MLERRRTDRERAEGVRLVEEALASAGQAQAAAREALDRGSPREAAQLARDGSAELSGLAELLAGEGPSGSGAREVDAREDGDALRAFPAALDEKPEVSNVIDLQSRRSAG